MIALDTNVVVRLVVNDDRNQTLRARQAIHRQNLWLSRTVLLETEWVLRGAYGLSRDDILGSLRTLLGMPEVHTDELARVAQALDDFAAGLDFADALHLAFAGEADSFATFDRTLARRADRLDRIKILAL